MEVFRKERKKAETDLISTSALILFGLKICFFSGTVITKGMFPLEFFSLDIHNEFYVKKKNAVQF